MYPSMHLVGVYVDRRGVDGGRGVWTKGNGQRVDRRCTPPAQPPLPPSDTATEAFGKHSTGMLSFFLMFHVYNVLFSLILDQSIIFLHSV